jgi:transposase InsO family protein
VRVEVEDAIVLVRKRLTEAGWDAGAEQILFWLGDHREQWGAAGEVVPVLPSRATVNRVLSRRGLVTPVPQRAPRRTRRFEHQHPNTLWQLDGFGWHLAGGSGVCVLHIVDDCSRVDIALRAVRSENTVDVWDTFAAASAQFGLPRMVLTDNGVAFSGKRRGWTTVLEQNLAELGVRHIPSSVAHPQTCGKCERAHRGVQQWLRAHPDPATLTELQALLDQYREHNNTRRRRTHLGGLTPMDRYRLGPVDGPGPGPLPEPVQVLLRTVTPSGTIGVGSKMIGLGRVHAGKSVHVFKQGTRLTVIAGHQHIATFTLSTRAGRYQSAHPSGKVSAKS